MATRYWVGGSGNWDATSTTNWAATSGGASGASAPTSVDDVIFDANSNTGTTAFAVTVTGTAATPAVCRDFSTGGAGGALDAILTFTMGATAQLDCYGSMTLPASNFAVSGIAGGLINFQATTTGKTLTTNGVTLTNLSITFNGIGGGWTLGSALTITLVINVINGTFNSGNYNISGGIFNAATGTNTRAVTLGSSTITLSGNNPWQTTSTGFTLNAGTSTIICSGAAPNFLGSGLSYYNVSFTTNAAGNLSITGANTYNNLTFTSLAATGIKFLSITGNQTVNGTLTLGTANTSVRRLFFRSGNIGTQYTVTVAAIAALNDVDFRDIVAAGAAGTWSGTRLGNAINNSNITFVAGKTVYWNLVGGGNWSSTAWAASSGGAVDANNFPLPQDTAIIENTGLNAAATITNDANWNLGSINASTRSTAMTYSVGNFPPIYGNVTLSSSVSFTGAGTFTFNNYVTSQTITSAGATFGTNVQIYGNVTLADNLTNTGATFSLATSTLNLNDKTLTCTTFNSSNGNGRAIAFGIGNITTTGSGTVWNTASTTNFSYTGTSTVNISNNSATATTVSTGSMTSAQALNFNYTTGTYTLTDTSAVYKTVNFTGFSGTIPNSTRTIYGGLTFSAGMTLTAGANVTTFAATSGTNNITTALKTLDFPITFFGVGGIFAFQDALTQGSTRAFTFTAGTVQLKNSATSTTGAFATSGSSQKYLQSTTPGTQATLTQASGTVDASYLTIKDINATGGATWNALWSNNNVDEGNNSGWVFGDPPIISAVEYTYALRSFTQPRRF